jgi:hypothetical protein
MDPERGVVLKHDRETWHVVPVVVASALNWDRFLAPPYDTSKLRKALMETVARKAAKKGVTG